jgi:hypothetical protein
MSAAELRLSPNAYRELYGRSFYSSYPLIPHALQALAPRFRVGNRLGWYVVLLREEIFAFTFTLAGAGRITALDDQGRTYISDIKGPQNGSDPDIFT